MDKCLKVATDILGNFMQSGGKFEGKGGGGSLLKTLIIPQTRQTWLQMSGCLYSPWLSVMGQYSRSVLSLPQEQGEDQYFEWLRSLPISVGHGLMEVGCAASFFPKGLPIALRWASAVTLQPSSHSYLLSPPCSSLPGPGHLDRKLTSYVPAGAWDSRDKLMRSGSKKITKLLRTLGVSAVWDPSISWKGQRFLCKNIKKEVDVFFWTLD